MLKQLMLDKKLRSLRKELEGLTEQETVLTTRNEELAGAIEEAETDEEMQVVEESVADLEGEKKELSEKKSKLEEEISKIETELEKIKAKDPTTAQKSKGVNTHMINRADITIADLVTREDVKEFLVRVRELGAQKRAVSGADLLIPEVMLGLLRDNIATSSKLISKVNYKPLKGKARQNISGTVPEAVWTEMVGALNELDLSFNQVEVDGYKVGGFIPVPNSILQDSDENLASEIMTALGKAIGIALDRAILFGTGVSGKQPLGIATRLAQTEAPAGYPANAPEWKNLSSTHISHTNATGTNLIGDIITAFGACKNDFSDGRRFYAMSTQTYSHLVTTLLSFNAAGAVATGMSNTMPILGGDIVILDFIPTGDIIGGYGDLYLLAEREGTTLAASEHVRFIEDQTVFKGLARYDGLPVIAEGFFAIKINSSSTDPATSSTFPIDWANPVLGSLTITSAAGASKGGTVLTLTDGGKPSGTFFGYRVGTASAPVDVKYGDYHKGFTPIEFDGTTGVADEEYVGHTKDEYYVTVAEFYYGIAIAAGSVKMNVKTS